MPTDFASLESAVAQATAAASAGRCGDCRALDRAIRRQAPGETRALFAALHCALVQELCEEAAILLDEGAQVVASHAPGQLPQLWQYAQFAAQAFSPVPAPLGLPPLGAMPLVSVVIPTLGGRDGLLNDALASVRAQVYANWELIVVNARDGELPIGDRDPRERRLEPGRHLNAAQARNLGIEQARGEVIAFLDDDDLWHPDFLRQTVDVLRPGRFAGVIGNCEAVEEEIDGGVRRVVRRTAPSIDRAFSLGLLQLRNYVLSHELVFRRAAIGERRFAESLQVWEDWEFLLGVAERGEFARTSTLTGEYRRRVAGGNHVSHLPADLDWHFDFIYARHPAANPAIEAARRVYRLVQAGAASTRSA